MTIFRAAQAAAAGVIDQVFGETFTLRPMTQIGGRLTTDPGRASVSITAIFTEKSAISDPIGERNASGMSKGVASAHGAGFATIEVKISDVPYAVVAKDRFVRAATGEVFEASGTPTTDLDHLVLRVMRLGIP